MRRSQDIEALAPGHREVIVSAEIVLQPVIGSQAHCADMIVIKRAEHVALRDIAEGSSSRERQRRSLRLEGNNAAVELEGFGPGQVVEEATHVAGMNLAV